MTCYVFSVLKQPDVVNVHIGLSNIMLTILIALALAGAYWMGLPSLPQWAQYCIDVGLFVAALSCCFGSDEDEESINIDILLTALIFGKCRLVHYGLL